jgi:hypothetical protein
VTVRTSVAPQVPKSIDYIYMEYAPMQEGGEQYIVHFGKSVIREQSFSVGPSHLEIVQ